jgi:ApbE superfamily uncharacterized protein (UPF0280 family)
MQRFYRDWIKGSTLINFEIKIFETDLLIFCDEMLKEKGEKIVSEYRRQLLDYMDKNSSFKESFKPIEMDGTAPEIAADMIRKSAIAGVGPTAGIAGAIAEYAGRSLLEHCSEIIVENGGDIFIKTNGETTLGIYAGNSPLSGKISLKVDSAKAPLGVCTSSGTVGHSKSFGIADAATVIARDAILADCVATQTANLVKTPDDLKKAVDYARSIEGVSGALVIAGDKLATGGEVELV